MNNLQRKVAFEKRKQGFLSRNLTKMRKSQKFTWVSVVCELPEWLADEIDGLRGHEIKNIIERGLINSEGLMKLIKTPGEETRTFKFRIGGELAREIKARSSAKRMGLANTVAELIEWGVN
jgi:hypothetical protein